ncbi:MAG: hypothetical protein MUF39_01195 [Cyclobacteriaceae bacterium]|jgi:hypothetical protein|nr:hypothetical protein [Cyclobacteriaceae bacterium]
MKMLSFVLVFSVLAWSCQENANTNEFTGNEVTYDLQPASQYDISGYVTMKEKRDGTTQVIVNLTGTSGNGNLPVHLHLGDITAADADVAALLSPVNAQTGKSETVLSQLANETSITYAELINLDACIKIHLSDVGPERDIILSGGNIGASVSRSIENGRIGFQPCKSE